jgi:DNA-binding beta-propeller fold protein YncE
MEKVSSAPASLNLPESFRVILGQGQQQKAIMIDKPAARQIFKVLVEKSLLLSKKINELQNKKQIAIPEISYVQFNQLMRVAPVLNDEKKLVAKLKEYDSPYTLTWLLQGAENLKLANLSLLVMKDLVMMVSGQKMERNWLAKKPSEQILRVTDFCSWFESMIDQLPRKQEIKKFVEAYLDIVIQKIAATKMNLPEKSVSAAEFDRDLLALASQGKVRTSSLAKPEQGKSVTAGKTIFSLSVGNNNEWLIAATETGPKVYAFDTLKPIAAVNAPAAQMAVAAHPQKPIFTFSKGNEVVLYEKNEQRSLANLGGYVTDMAFSPDGNYLAVAGFDKSVFLFDVPEGKLNRTIVIGETSTAVCFDTASEYLFVGTQSGKFIRKNVKGLVSADKEFKLYANPISSIAVNQKSTIVAMGFMNGVVAIVNTATGEKLLQAKVPGEVRALQFLPDGNLLRAIDSNGELLLIDLQLLNFRQPLMLCEKMILANLISPVLEKEHKEKGVQQSKLIIHVMKLSTDFSELLSKLPPALDIRLRNHLKFEERERRYDFKKEEKPKEMTTQEIMKELEKLSKEEGVEEVLPEQKAVQEKTTTAIPPAVQKNFLQRFYSWLTGK